MINITDTGISIENLNIDIPIGPVGLSFSAGADSTILAYILMKYHPGMIHLFTMASKLRKRAETLNTITVIDKLIDLTGRTDNMMQHITYIEHTNNEIIGTHLMEQAEIFKTEVVYTGLTQSPPDGVINTPIESHQFGLRNNKIIKEPYRRNKSIYHPLININKRDVKKLYDIFKVTASLFPYTRSCYLESTDLDFEGVYALSNTKHCDNCWWCEERKWAFGKL
jgi:7-cyano-7-deazaguanine synthase in queuosine biosynthesis